MTTTLSLVAVLAIASVSGLNNAFAEESSGYKMADDIRAVFTFTFKDGVEIHEFPVFNMEDDYVADINISPSFSVQGVVGNAPLLHRALDESFKYKANPSYEYNFQLFEVDVDFVKNGESIRTLSYHDCKVDTYKVETLTATYESYLSTSFAIIDDIDFQCSGITPLVETSNITWQTGYNTIEYPQTPYKFAEDVRTFITFEFDQGIEKIEFPFFKLNSGFAEKNDNVVPGFSVEGTISEHPLLNLAIENARKTSALAYGQNVDFEATVEFTQSDHIIRTLNFKDCRVTGTEMKTQYDKEEGFSGKSGFAFVDDIDFECIGLSTTNNAYDDLGGDRPSWSAVKFENILPLHEYKLGTGPRAVATFTYDEGVEVIDFPIFNQGTILKKANPTFELAGVVRDSTILYNNVDDNLAITSSTGSNNFLDLFDVDVELVYGEDVVRGFNYVDCRVTDYVVETQRDKEESYFKGFVLSNTFDFECEGYHPNNPIYDYMMENHDRAKTISSTDLTLTDDWGPGFKQE
jgi:hypothetical protein